MLFVNFANYLELKKAYDPNQMVWSRERTDLTEKMLTAFKSDNQNDWDEYIYLLMLAYHSSEHKSTGFSPCQMIFAKQPTLPIDLILGKPESNFNDEYTTEYVEGLKLKLDKIHDWARQNLNPFLQKYEKAI